FLIAEIAPIIPEPRIADAGIEIAEEAHRHLFRPEDRDLALRCRYLLTCRALRHLQQIDGHLDLPGLRQIAWLEPAGHDRARVHLIAELGIEGLNIRIGVADHELDLAQAPHRGPARGVMDKSTADILMATIRLHRQAIDPGAMAVMAN